MIDRIKQIEGVGKFLSAKNLGGLKFSEFNLIYGGNTRGKSTLTAIFKSLKLGDKSVIEGRKTFGVSSQKIVIQLANEGEISFSSNKWNNGIKDIIIFDEDFINNNVHLGGQIIYDNQKSLNSIIIGEEGQKLAIEIEQLQSEISKVTANKKKHGNIFTNRFPEAPITLQKFRKLKNIEDIDKEILKVEAQIDDYNNQDNIKSKCNQIENVFSSIPEYSIINLLSKHFKLNKEYVIEHIQKTWNKSENSFNFLQQGFQLLKEEPKDCVFCGQSLNIDALKLLNEYSKLFSKEFIDFQKQISSVINDFNNWNIELAISQIKTIGGMIKINIDIPKDKLIELKNECNNEFNKKLNDLSYSINFQEFEELIKTFEDIKEEYNTQKKSKLKEINIDLKELKSKLSTLQFTKIRYSTTENWESYFEKKDDLDKEFKLLKQKREQKREELEIYGREIYKKNHQTINEVLSNLQADYRLDEFIPLKKIIGKTERIFSLVFYNNHKITLETENSAIPNFKNSLSESDKRVLAFSFFISLLKNNEKLNNKIIILDDPFSSLDKERRRAIIKEIQNISFNSTMSKPKQIIILTHELDFYKWCLIKFPEATALEIQNEGMQDGIKKSTILRTNKELYLESDTRKDLKEIIKLIDNNITPTEIEGLFSKSRKILEDVFTKKYYSHLKEDIKSRKSIRTFTETLKSNNVNQFETQNKFSQIINLCDDLNIELHNNELKNEGENGINVLQDFIKCLEII
ncbi:AAA family ATPase [Cellulophaga baltica]|uniref:AAA family ATPase n=1 Tax=Cellulophaga TaxID=104264 RepID=UPI001C07B342|nr:MULTISPECIES: AAA family ATPase [Cellulophaga]MBU2996644.1 AAA family ATPase [Cellulophaga baltica]MDO6768038.1 AAA family ATPase [Cellulophaga sp. 1_MG-2023]